MTEKTEKNGSHSKIKKHKSFRMDKNHVQGFLAGVVLCAIAFAGFYFGTDGNFFTGTVASLAKVTDSNFSEEVLHADRPVVVVVTADWDGSTISKTNLNSATAFASYYGNYCKVVTMNIDNAPSMSTKYNIYSSQSLLLFANGGLVARRSSVSTEPALMGWVSNNVIWEYHESQQGDTDAVATVYNLFHSGSSYARANYVDADVTGEIKLFPFDASGDTYNACQGQTFTGSQYVTLGLTFPVSVNNNNMTVTISDFTGSEPEKGVNYYVCLDGTSPKETTSTATTVGNISYFGLDCAAFDNFYLGEIKLIRNLDESKYTDFLIPCDGRTLKISDHQALYSLLGTTYGGDGTTTFGVPDLSGKSPVDGCTYYIMLQGIYMY